VFLPLTSPSYDFFGGDRKGANPFGNSVVALERATGQRRWHFQTVHDDPWDYDLPAAPVPVTVKREGLYLPFGERDQALFPGLNGGARLRRRVLQPGEPPPPWAR
jgi:hypothetical protein